MNQEALQKHASDHLLHFQSLRITVRRPEEMKKSMTKEMRMGIWPTKLIGDRADEMESSLRAKLLGKRLKHLRCRAVWIEVWALRALSS